MNARILFVDDEPDLEALITAEIPPPDPGRNGASFLFARDGIEALAALKANSDIDLVVTDINMPRMDGLSLLQKLQEQRRRRIDHHRVGLWRHGQYPHRDESRRIRFRHQADRFRRSGNHHRQDAAPHRSPARCASAPGRGRTTCGWAK